MFIGAVGPGTLLFLRNVKNHLPTNQAGSYGLTTPEKEEVTVSIFKHPLGGVNNIGVAVQNSQHVISSLVNLSSGEVESPSKLQLGTGKFLESEGEKKQLTSYVEEMLEGLTRASLDKTISKLPSPPDHQ